MTCTKYLVGLRELYWVLHRPLRPEGKEQLLSGAIKQLPQTTSSPMAGADRQQLLLAIPHCLMPRVYLYSVLERHKQPGHLCSLPVYSRSWQGNLRKAAFQWSGLYTLHYDHERGRERSNSLGDSFHFNILLEGTQCPLSKTGHVISEKKTTPTRWIVGHWWKRHWEKLLFQELRHRQGR